MRITPNHLLTNGGNLFDAIGRPFDCKEFVKKLQALSKWLRLRGHYGVERRDDRPTFAAVISAPTVSSRLRRRKLMRPAVGHGVALLPKTFQRLCVYLRCTSTLACESMQETTTPSNLGAEDNATYSIQYEWQTREVEFHNVRSLIRRICF